MRRNLSALELEKTLAHLRLPSRSEKMKESVKASENPVAFVRSLPVPPVDKSMMDKAVERIEKKYFEMRRAETLTLVCDEDEAELVTYLLREFRVGKAALIRLALTELYKRVKREEEECRKRLNTKK